METLLADAGRIAALARRYHERECLFFIGRGLDYAVALEGSLKLKEISYIHAEAYAAGELKHGTLALITEGVPVIALATQPDLFEKTLSNIKEVKARGAEVVALTFAGEYDTEDVGDTSSTCRPHTRFWRPSWPWFRCSSSPTTRPFSGAARSINPETWPKA